MSVKLFFCYAHEDEPLLNKLKTHLKPLQRMGLIDVWHDRDDDSPDYHPILDRIEPYTGLYCAVGFSGHGLPLFPSRSRRRRSLPFQSVLHRVSINGLLLRGLVVVSPSRQIPP
jgi:hypothetical protein